MSAPPKRARFRHLPGHAVTTVCTCRSLGAGDGTSSHLQSSRKKRAPLPDSSDEDGEFVKAVPISRRPVHELATRLSAPAAIENSQSNDDESEDSEYSEQDGGQAQGQQESLSLGERTGALAQQRVGFRRQDLKSATKEAPADDDDGSLPKKNARLNKHAPVEERISRKPVSVLRDSVQRKNFKPKDPRFLPYLRTDDPKEEDFANRRYAFLYEESIPSEVKELKAHMKKAKTPHEKQQAQTKLSRLTETLKRHDDRRLEQEVEDEWKKQERIKLEAGKKPFYLKDSEKKKRVLEKKFTRLEETGQLENYMLKKRKRQASKMHKKLPDRRQFTD